MGQQIRAFVFDMDGVLIDSHSTHRRAWKEFLQSEGRRVSDQELAFILEGHTRSEILRHFLGNLEEEELLAYGSRKDDIFRSLEHEIHAVDGVVAFLEKLRRIGVNLAIATSASEIRTASTIERLGLGGCFDAVITASDVELGKPDPAVYRLACERLNILPSDAIAFDDAHAGVQAAKAAGMRCIGVANRDLREHLLEAGAEAVIADFACAEFRRAEASLLNGGAALESDESYIYKNSRASRSHLVTRYR
jgi:HAD superfamily hydrolase (TIGR01509 family)